MRTTKILTLILLLSQTFFAQNGGQIEQDKKAVYKDENYIKAREADAQGDFRISADWCLKGIKESPFDLDLKQQLGKSYMHLKKLDSARYFLRKVIDENPDNVASRHYLVNVEFQSKRYSSAICYINELLEKTPYWRGLWLKKIDIYEKMGNEEEAKRALNRLHQIFPKDTLVTERYNYALIQTNLKKDKKGDYNAVRDNYLRVLKLDPYNKESRINLISNELKAGRFDDAYTQAETALLYFPDDTDVIKKKISVLDIQKKYETALVFLKEKKSALDASYYKNIENYFILKAAEYYENTDAYTLHKKAYGINSNETSFNYLLKRSWEKGYYTEAIYYIDEGLKKRPNDKKLLYKKLLAFKYLNRKREYEVLIEDLQKKYKTDYDIQNEYAIHTLSKIKYYRSENQYYEALDLCFLLVKNKEYEQVANKFIYDIYIQQGRFEEAKVQIEYMTKRYPKSSEELMVKESALNKDSGDFDKALVMTQKLMDTYPKKEKYKKQYVYFSELYAKKLMESKEYLRVLDVTKNGLEKAPKNKVLHNYNINTASEMKDYQLMLDFSNKALENHPEDINYALNKATALSNLNQNDKTLSILDSLHKAHPKSLKIKGLMEEERFAYGVRQQNEEEYEAAEDTYQSIIEDNPTNEDARKRLINVAIVKKDTTQALKHINYMLDKRPNDKFYLGKKGVVFEIMEEYDLAYTYQKMGMKKIPDPNERSEYLEYLKSKSYKNQLGVSYLRVNSDSINFSSSLASIGYLRFADDKNTYGGNLNYAARRNGVGLQLHGLWAHTFRKDIYGNLNLYIGSRFFPKWKIAATGYKYFTNDWEAELGVGLARFQDNSTWLNIQPGLSKQLGDFWVNARVNFLFNNDLSYNTIFAQSRYYINKVGDYFMVNASVGTAPLDERLAFQIDTFTTYTNSLVGAGYFRHTHHKYTFGIIGNWYNYKVSPTTNINQYHLLAVLKTRFN